MSDSPWSDLGRPPLRQAALRAALTRPPWTTIEVVAATGSTNQDLTRQARSGAARAGSVLLADHQTQGRGRRERSWTAPPRSSIAVSALLMPSCAPGSVPLSLWSWLPLLVGVGTAEALVSVAGLDARLKWPNDVLVDTPAGAPARSGWHKVCGVLAEVVPTPSGQGVVVGVGLNVTQSEEELPPVGPGGLPAASLTTLGAATTDRDTVLRAVLRAVGDRYTAWVDAHGDPRASGVAAAYRERCVTIGLQVAAHLPGGEVLQGVAEGVDDDGHLMVRVDDENDVRPLAAADVVHLRSPGHPDRPLRPPPG